MKMLERISGKNGKLRINISGIMPDGLSILNELSQYLESHTIRTEADVAGFREKVMDELVGKKVCESSGKFINKLPDQVSEFVLKEAENVQGNVDGVVKQDLDVVFTPKARDLLGVPDSHPNERHLPRKETTLINNIVDLMARKPNPNSDEDDEGTYDSKRYLGEGIDEGIRWDQLPRSKKKSTKIIDFGPAVRRRNIENLLAEAGDILKGSENELMHALSQPENPVLEHFQFIVSAINQGKVCKITTELVSILNAVGEKGLEVLDNLIDQTESTDIAAKFKHLLRVEFDKGLDSRIINAGIIKITQERKQEIETIESIKEKLGDDINFVLDNGESIVVVREDSIKNALREEKNIQTEISKMIKFIETEIRSKEKQSNSYRLKQAIASKLSSKFLGMNQGLYGIILGRCLLEIDVDESEQEIFDKIKEKLEELVEPERICHASDVGDAIDEIVDELIKSS